MKKPRLLWVTDKPDQLQGKLQAQLIGQGFEFVEAGSKELLNPVKEGRTDLVIAWEVMADPALLSGSAREIKKLAKKVPIILVARHSSEELAIAALRAGISDYFKIPCTCEELLAGIRRCLPDISTRVSWNRSVSPKEIGLSGGEKMVGQSSSIREPEIILKKLPPQTVPPSLPVRPVPARNWRRH